MSWYLSAMLMDALYRFGVDYGFFSSPMDPAVLAIFLLILCCHYRIISFIWCCHGYVPGRSHSDGCGELWSSSESSLDGNHGQICGFSSGNDGLHQVAFVSALASINSQNHLLGTILMHAIVTVPIASPWQS